MAKLVSKLCLALLSLSAIPSVALADTYRWIDDKGVVNYSEMKPRGIDAERVTQVGGAGNTNARTTQRTQPAPSRAQPVSRTISNSAANGGAEPLSQNQQEMLQKLQQTEAARQEEIAAIRQDNCERSRRVLANLSAKDRIRVREADGTQRVMPEEERQEGISNAQQGIVQNCEV